MTTLWGYRWPTSVWTAPWDNGISWRSELVEPPTQLIVDPSYIAEKVLRVANDDADLEHIKNLILSATDLAEQETQRALMPQTWRLILSGGPTGVIKLPRPPFIEIESIGYRDSDDAEQSWDGSPAEYVVSPSGRYTKARLSYVSAWPTVGTHPDALTITYRAGFTNLKESPAPMIIRGIELAVGELYDKGTLTTDLSRFWRMVVDD